MTYEQWLTEVKTRLTDKKIPLREDSVYRELYDRDFTPLQVWSEYQHEEQE